MEKRYDPIQVNTHPGPTSLSVQLMLDRTGSAKIA